MPGIKYTKELLQEVVKDAYSYAMVLRKLNLRPAGGNYRLLKARLTDFGIDISHFKGHGWSMGLTIESSDSVRKAVLRKMIPDSEVFTRDSRYFSTCQLKKRLVKLGMVEKCAVCGISSWQGTILKLHLDHIDGDPTNNEITNLRLLCPNCHSQTETYTGKNIKNTTKGVRKHESYVRVYNKDDLIVETHPCKSCGKEIGLGRKHCSQECAKLSARKSQRPPRETLLSEITSMSLLAVGRKYGVSDNSIRKWCEAYGINVRTIDIPFKRNRGLV